MKASRLEALEVGGLTGVTMRARIELKLADRFYAVLGNKRQFHFSVVYGLLGIFLTAWLMLMLFDPYFEPLRAFGIALAQTPFGEPRSYIVMFTSAEFWVLTLISGIYAAFAINAVFMWVRFVQTTIDLARKVSLYLNTARDEKVDL